MKTSKLSKISNPLKLSKFQLEQLSVAEMNAIKAGSGYTDSAGPTICTGTDSDADLLDND
jgi:hypothetical protein